MEQGEDDQIRQRNWNVSAGLWTIRGSDFYRKPDAALNELWETSKGSVRLRLAARWNRPEEVKDRIDYAGSYSGFRHSRQVSRES